MTKPGTLYVNYVNHEKGNNSNKSLLSSILRSLLETDRNGPVSNYQSSHLALRLRGIKQRNELLIPGSPCYFLLLFYSSSKPRSQVQVNSNNSKLAYSNVVIRVTEDIAVWKQRRKTLFLTSLQIALIISPPTKGINS